MNGRRGFLKSILAAPVAVAAAPVSEPVKPKAPVFQPHTVWRTRHIGKDGRWHPIGQPVQVLLKSWDDQIEYCRLEGLIQPGTDVHISEQGEMIVKPYKSEGPMAIDASARRERGL
jgi:hypothetical protein